MNISVVIITKNEEKNISDCLKSAFLISKNVIVADSGSTDNTVVIAKEMGADVLRVNWQGYGNTRNEGAKYALHEWILALDADERITPLLANEINKLQFNDDAILYGFRRESFLVKKKIQYGDWGRDKVFRLYNKQKTTWDLATVHENIITTGLKKQIIRGSILHYTMDSIESFYNKTIHYANLSATKYFNQQKKATFIKRFGSPLFAFIQCYILRLGFLDGVAGFIIAKYSAFYVWKKYDLLRKMYQSVN